MLAFVVTFCAVNWYLFGHWNRRAGKGGGEFMCIYIYM